MWLLSTTQVAVVLNGELCGASDTAEIKAMRNGRVLVGNYCGSLAGESLLIKPQDSFYT